MRLIEINTWGEFHKKLKDIKGNEYVYVKILCQERKGKIEAVDLQKFKGTLEINFSNENKMYLFEVSHPVDFSVREFFYNSNKACVTMNYRGVLKFVYRAIPKKTIAISSVEQLQKEINKTDKNRSLVLSNDLLFKNMPCQMQEKIDAAGFKVFIPKTDIALSSHFINAQFVFYDSYLEIKNVEDLHILEKFSHGNIVVSLHNDLKKFVMKPINLSKFSGNLYIFGNHCSINNGRVLISSVSGGFIKELHPYANVYIENLGFERLVFCGNKPYYCGTVLGMRTRFGYQSPEGRIVLKNCWVKNVLMPESYLHTDVFVGDTSVDYDLIDVYSCRVFANKREIYPTKSEVFELKRKK